MACHPSIMAKHELSDAGPVAACAILPIVAHPTPTPIAIVTVLLPLSLSPVSPDSPESSACQNLACVPLHASCDGTGSFTLRFHGKLNYLKVAKGEKLLKGKEPAALLCSPAAPQESACP